MSDKNEPRHRGSVTECLPNQEFRVHIHDAAEGTTVRCYTAGKLKIARIHILLGDEVDCIIPKGSAVGRIVFRHLPKRKKFDE